MFRGGCGCDYGGPSDSRAEVPAVVPTLFRFLVVLSLLAATAYAIIFALATFVGPMTGEMSVRVPLDRLEQPAN